MANIEWSEIYSTTTNFAFRLGLLVDTVESNTQVTVKVQVWFWSQHSLNDVINLFYRAGQGITTAFDDTYLVSRPHVKCTGNGGAGWWSENQILLYNTSHTYTRGTSAQTINIYAHVGEIYNYSTSKGGLITASRSVSIPALSTSLITYDANGGTGAPGSQTKTYGIPIQLSSKTPTRTGYTFKGWALEKEYADDGLAYFQAGEWCAVDGGLTLYAAWEIKTYSNTIEHWASGWKNGEGNNYKKDCFKLAESTFDCQYGSTFELSASRGTTIPKGFYLYGVVPSYVAGAWKDYSIGTKLTQQTESMSFQYSYHPHDYTITYNLEGGVFDCDPPTTYNVLYPVLFPAPKRAGYSFAGWYIDGLNGSVSGVNVGVNASFTSAEDLYVKLAARMTGNVTVTARWADNGTAHVKQDGGFKKGQVWFNDAGTWKRGIPWEKVNGEWKRGGA